MTFDEFISHQSMLISIFRGCSEYFFITLTVVTFFFIMKILDWERLYWEYRDPILNYCSHYCQNKDEAEDITQEVFIKAQTLTEIDQNKSIKAYLYQITRNLCLNRIRDLQRHQQIEKFIWSKSFFFNSSKIDIQDPNRGPELEMLKQETTNTLLKCLDDLPTDQREVILLKYQDQMSRHDVYK